METKKHELDVERRARSYETLRTATGTSGPREASSRAVGSALNRVIVAGRSEIMALMAGTRIVDGAERRERLRAQVERRLVFQRDLVAVVSALGGVPARHAAGGARLAAGTRRVHELLFGPHEGDTYAVCARATEVTATAYAKALTIGLPPDVRFGLARQYAEVDWDRSELRRLRWGASLTPLPGSSAHPLARPNAGAPNEAADTRALEVWSEEGGPGPGGSRSANAGAPVAGATE